MIRIKTQEEINKEKVTKDLVAMTFTKENVRLLAKYYFKFKKADIKTVGDNKRAADIIEKLETIENLRSRYKCTYSYWQCYVLISEGYFDLLCYSIQENCFINDRYRILKGVIKKAIEENKYEKPEEVIVKKEKPKKSPEMEFNIDKMKSIERFIKTKGGLTKLELRLLMTSLGYTIKKGRIEKIEETKESSLNI